MDHPDEPAGISYSPAGLIEDKPEKVISIVVTDQDDDPVGVLEKWSGDAWIYADAESLVEMKE